MFKTSNKKFIKFLCQFTAIILILIMFVSCGGNTPSGGNNNKNKTDNTKKPETTNNQQNDPTYPGSSFSNFSATKNDFISVISDALSNNGYAFNSMDLLGVIMADLALVPVTSFGVGEQAAESALKVLGFQNIQYSESGNNYIIKVRNEEGEELEVNGEYDKNADALKCTLLINGNKKMILEYRKTSFGYVGQYYAIDEEGTSSIYCVSVSGKDGAVGISTATSAPPALTGNETIDFPKQCEIWYAKNGDAITGKTSGGEEISFTYVPQNDE